MFAVQFASPPSEPGLGHVQGGFFRGHVFRSGAQDSLATLQVCFGPAQLSLFRAEFRFAQAELLLFRLGGGQKPSGIFEFSLGRGFAALRLLGRGDLAILPLLPGRRQELLALREVRLG